MLEKEIEKNILIKCNGRGNRLWKNESGMAFRWIDDKAVPIKYGLCKGSSDLIGFTEMKITEAMVGKTVAVFTALEVKSLKGRATDEQADFIQMVRSHGGISDIVRSPEDVDFVQQEFQVRLQEVF